MKWNPSRVLMVIVLVLLAIGVVMLASTSFVKGEASKDDASYFIKRQLVWMALAFAVTILVAHLNYRLWSRCSYLLLGVSVALLVAVVVFGEEINGSKRWLNIAGGIRFQPSEVAKFSVVAALAHWMARVGPLARRLREGLILPGIAVGLVALLILIEPDFGTCMLVGAVSIIVMFMGGSRVGHLAAAGFAALLALSLLIMQNKERADRLGSFLHPEENPEDAYQLIQAEHALILGGPLGVGLGNSSQKFFYLPEAHTDFILPIIGEEAGMTTIVIVLLYAGILVCGTAISLESQDMFGRLLGMGITSMITLQAAINIGVCTGVLPTKGLPLPLISYGGTSLVMTMVSLGVLLSIGRAPADPRAALEPDVSRDRARTL